MVNDDLPAHIITGSVKIKDDVKRFLPHGVEFVDGTREDDIDVVILATGYTLTLPFLDKDGLIQLPKEEEMWRDIRNREESIAKSSVPSKRYIALVYYSEIMDEIAALVGCKPKLGDIGFTITVSKGDIGVTITVSKGDIGVTITVSKEDIGVTITVSKGDIGVTISKVTARRSAATVC
ncbi:dimethylaniline monooxygenase [n-oxide-forming] [Plakobranchus ocellatus]|uniref:Flavin-containing monooxygenase n=1 Tax=Plakobranchus ocellatus TaxID=259542 RepID=A0AAV3YM16_9GAST|nr:dimethylaniline monooxygenase [n-oxide-forming] [Plakobranchus ocellatus]